ncbi:MAG: hypothetical protein KF901_24380 [Myxococcales bacterium]|nr:hypothetical protein [Myxococcales bacterium]
MIARTRAALIAPVFGGAVLGWAVLGCSGAGSTTTPAALPPPTSELEAPRAESPSEQDPVAPAVEPPPEVRDPIPETRDQLALGGAFGCATARGRVFCWGSNRFGQLGDPALEQSVRSARGLAQVADVRARRIAVGSWHACTLGDEGVVACWGHDGWGQLGDGRYEDRARPQAVAELRDAVDVCAGEGHGCARLADRRVVCWGRNHLGQLGDGTYEDRVTPTLVSIEDVVEIRCGRAHTCARHTDGMVSCWGENLEGQLGDGGRSAPEGSRARPAPVPELRARALALGPSTSCAITTDGIAQCWGRGGAFGVTADAPSPVALPGVEGAVVAVAPGGRHTCALDETGRVWCLGTNRWGQLGDGSRTPRSRAVEVARGALDLAAGVDHTCARFEGDELRCWGTNREGQLGLPSRERFRTSPVRLATLPAAP